MSAPFAEVIGDPIAQSKSPLIHNFWLEKLGIAGEYARAHVTAEGLADYLAARRDEVRWQGCNVTMPHKQAIMPLLDQIDPAAARIGAVNTVQRGADGDLRGFNTDVAGFLEPLGGQKFSRVTVIGAGGAARAVLAGLADQAVSWISLQNRSIAKGEALLSEFGLNGCVTAVGEEVPAAELLVNTSSLGMLGQPPLPPVERYVMDGGVVFDIVYSPLDTELLKAARARGQQTIDGLAMLIGQAAVAFEKFFGQPAPRQHDAQLRELLVR